LGNGEGGVAVDGSVIAALITSGAALVVAVGNGLRGGRVAAAERRYERTRTSLEEAQDAVLALRTALTEYGTALRARTVQAPAGRGVFVMSVPDELANSVRAAESGLQVARSRIEDPALVEAIERWRALARVSLIDPRDGEASAEERAFAEVVDLIGVALRSGGGA
jgi:hypothetical protein